MVPIAYASSEGSDEPAHPRKITSALTAHIHNEAVNLKSDNRDISEFALSVFVTCEDQPAHRTVSSAFLKQNIKPFVGQVLGPNCLLN